jgi:hypothetical protein
VPEQTGSWLLVVLGLGACAALWMTGLARSGEAWPRAFVRGYVIAWTCYLMAALIATRARGLAPWAVIWIVAAALGMRVISLQRAPPLSTDYWRYLWDGRIINAGINPYRYRPDAGELRPFRDANWRKVNFKHVPTVYPPGAEVLFAGLARIRSRDGEAFRYTFLIFDMASVLALTALLRRTSRPAERVIWYAWCPLAVTEVTAGAHVDAFGLFLLLLALWLAAREEGRPGPASAVALGGAALSKGFAALALPLFVRRGGWAVLLFFGAACLVMLAPFSGAGRHMFRGVGEYFGHWETNSSVFFLTHWTLTRLSVPVPADYYIARGLSAVAILGVVGWLTWRQRPGLEELLRSVFAALAACLLLGAPTLPWYVVWALPLLCWRPVAGGVLFTLLVSTNYYLRWVYGDRYHLLLWVEYLPVYALLMGQFIWWRARERHPRASPAP